MRLFIAIDCKELEDYFKDIQNNLPIDIAKLRPVNTFHLTLKFLGDMEDPDLDKIKEQLSKIRFEGFNLTLDNLGFFPSRGYVKVIWIGVKENKELLKLQKEIDNALEDFHFRRDFEFLPHLTLARVGFINNRQEFIDQINSINVEPKEMTVKEFKLIKSTLARDGPVYDDLDIYSANP